jgi:hypothetical protein
MASTAAAGSGRKLSTRPRHHDVELAGRKVGGVAHDELRAGVGDVVGRPGNIPSDGSTPTAAAGLQRARIAAVSAPVPQPTFSHRSPAGTPSQSTNSTATSRLHRPTYGS